MGRIVILDDHIANQIAAGEVVERPASIVKELIENSIDANSTRIDIEIEEGGLSSIRVADNGNGLDRDDVEKAFLRHATSKIKTGNDLFRIKTLGFRGEALPSISAVSRLTLRTSNSQDGHGIKLNLEGGNVKEKDEVAFRQGTEIIVKDLFFNTPARLKYLKTLQTEIGHITDYVNRLSLAYPHIAFTLIHNGRPIIKTNGDKQLLHVLAAVYGLSVAKKMIKIENEDLDFKITGFTSSPEITRANKNHISLFVNGRYIKHYSLTQAIIRGYNTLLMINRFPISVLHIELDPAIVDVNVHPAKLEVRFSKEQELMKLVEKTIYQSLSNESFIREPEPTTFSNKSIKVQTEQASFEFSRNYDLKPKNSSSYEGYNQVNEQKLNKDKGLTDSEHDKSNEQNKDKSNDSLSIQNEQNKVERLMMLEPIAQYNGTYIIAQNSSGLYLIDQHAAHERINYEKHLNQMNEEHISSQELLVPITLEYLRTEALQLNRKLSLLQAHGIEIEPFGHQSFLIRSVPNWMPNGKETQFIETMVEMVLESDQIDMTELRKDILASSSCKISIKANQSLSITEMEQLLESLRKTTNPFSCPHGRPIIIHFSNYEIEKMFKRVI